MPDEATACLSTEPNPLHTAPHVQQTMSTADDHSPLLSTTSMDAALSDAEFWGLRIGTVRLLAMAFSQSSSSPPDLPPGTKPMQGPFLTAQAAVRHMLSSSGTTAAVLAACVPCLPSSDRIGQPGVLPPVGTPGSKDQPVMVFNRQLGVLEVGADRSSGTCIVPHRQSVAAADTRCEDVGGDATAWPGSGVMQVAQLSCVMSPLSLADIDRMV